MWRATGRETKIRIFHRIEECLTNDNTLVRRAATELLCNLMSCEAGYLEYTATANARSASRLRLMLILTGSDDLATRLAAGGAIATITESPEACATLLNDKERSAWSRVISYLEYQDEEEDEDGNVIPVISSLPPDEASIYRAAIILYNLVTYVTGLEEKLKKEEMERIKKDGVQEALMRVLRSKVGNETLEPIVECLKLLKRHEN